MGSPPLQQIVFQNKRIDYLRKDRQNPSLVPTEPSDPTTTSSPPVETQPSQAPQSSQPTVPAQPVQPVEAFWPTETSSLWLEMEVLRFIGILWTVCLVIPIFLRWFRCQKSKRSVLVSGIQVEQVSNDLDEIFRLFSNK